jgi:hypothetical protein
MCTTNDDESNQFIVCSTDFPTLAYVGTRKVVLNSSLFRSNSYTFLRSDLVSTSMHFVRDGVFLALANYAAVPFGTSRRRAPSVGICCHYCFGSDSFVASWSRVSSKFMAIEPLTYAILSLIYRSFATSAPRGNAPYVAYLSFRAFFGAKELRAATHFPRETNDEEKPRRRSKGDQEVKS